VLEVGVGVIAALAVVIAGSDFLPNEYPSAKNSAQIPTSPKNRTSSFPVPSVISVSSDEVIVPLQTVGCNRTATLQRPLLPAQPWKSSASSAAKSVSN
jgi:hypothetical protein